MRIGISERRSALATLLAKPLWPIVFLYFASEYTNSFYEFQGFMEGTALSDIRAASEILQDIKVGALR